jgi:hypothetical protein
MRVEPGPFLDENLWKAGLKANAHFGASALIEKLSVMHNPGLNNTAGTRVTREIDIKQKALENNRELFV